MAFTQPTLDELKTQARQMADMENDPFIGDDELTQYINKSWAKVYDVMITTYGENYYVFDPLNPFTFVTDGVSEFYPLPSDFYKLLGVDFCLTGNSPDNPNNFLTMWPFNMAARNRSTIAPVSGNIVAPTDYRYKIFGDKLWFRPVIMAGCTIRAWYAPTLTPLVNGTDETTMLQPGWDELIIVDAAIKMCIKAEQDTTQLQAYKLEAVTHLQSVATNRDAGAPATVVDVYGPGSGIGDMAGDGAWGGVWW